MSLSGHQRKLRGCPLNTVFFFLYLNFKTDLQYEHYSTNTIYNTILTVLTVTLLTVSTQHSIRYLHRRRSRGWQGGCSPLKRRFRGHSPFHISVPKYVRTMCVAFNKTPVTKTLLGEFHKLSRMYLTLPAASATLERTFFFPFVDSITT